VLKNNMIGEKMKKRIAVLTLILILNLFLFADVFEINLTRKERNLYKENQKNLLIQTRFCFEFAFAADAILKIDGLSKFVIFTNSGNKCDVKAIYKKIEINEQKKVVNVYKIEDGWYQIMGTDIYFLTTSCLNLSLSADVVLNVYKNNLGGMIQFDKYSSCSIEGFYSKI